jgi:SAM-dependent methyltransferase
VRTGVKFKAPKRSNVPGRRWQAAFESRVGYLAPRCSGIIGPSRLGLDYGPRVHGDEHQGDTNADDTRAVIEARIRRAVEYGRGSIALSGQFSAGDPQQSERRRHALQMVDERADLVGFALSSGLKGLGRVSTLVREGLRRALLEVLFRQSEFNRASGELIRSHEAQVRALGATARAQIGVQLDADERLNALEERLARVEVARAGLADVDHLSFAASFCGTTEERRERLRRFLPRFEDRSEVLDAGCGRGEFLELLREANIGAVGVDTDQSMVTRCRSLGLEVIHDDVLHFLSERSEGSLGGIFAARLIEHLERGEIVELVRLTFSRLAPGGVLVVETVNPLCLSTYASFYGDFTRVAPVPPLAMQWLAESVGFVSVGIEYTSPVPDERKMTPLPASAGAGAEVEAFNRGVAAANELLFGFQEYALTAEKPG